MSRVSHVLYKFLLLLLLAPSLPRVACGACIRALVRHLPGGPFPDSSSEVWFSGLEGLTAKHLSPHTCDLSLLFLHPRVETASWRYSYHCMTLYDTSCLPFWFSTTCVKSLHVGFSLVRYLFTDWTLADVKIITRNGLRKQTLKMVFGDSIGHAIRFEGRAEFHANGN